MKFEERLMELRKSKGWSQEQLGDKLGVTRQTVSKWELGMTTPEMEKLAAISDLFEISLDELIKGTSASSTHVNIAEKHTSRKPHYEYKSKRTIHGIPLVHINVGIGRCYAKGIFAVGNAAVGVVSLGLASIGVVSFGLASLGVLALGLAALGIFAAGCAAAGVIAAGSFALGVLAFGGMSAGWLAYGGLASGVYAIGGFADAQLISFGGIAHGVIAIGEKTEGEICINAPMAVEEFRSTLYSRLPDTPSFIADIFTELAQHFN